MKKYDQECEPLVISKTLIDLFRKENDTGDLIALYIFYYYTAKWQCTDTAWSSTGYTAEGLDWSVARVRKIKTVLLRLGLIEDYQHKNDKGQIVKHFVYVRFMWSDLKVREIQEQVQDREETTLQKNHSVGDVQSNALSVDKVNALSGDTLNQTPTPFSVLTSTSSINRRTRTAEEVPIPLQVNRPVRPPTPYQLLSIQLAAIVQAHHRIKIPDYDIVKWEKLIKKLCIDKEISTDRVKVVLDWYTIHQNDEYAHKLENGLHLSKKFISIEDQMHKQQGTVKQVGPTTPPKRKFDVHPHDRSMDKITPDQEAANAAQLELDMREAYPHRYK